MRQSKVEDAAWECGGIGVWASGAVFPGTSGQSWRQGLFRFSSADSHKKAQKAQKKPTPQPPPSFSSAFTRQLQRASASGPRGSARKIQTAPCRQRPPKHGSLKLRLDCRLKAELKPGHRRSTPPAVLKPGECFAFYMLSSVSMVSASRPSFRIIWTRLLSSRRAL